jgi:uncharacterized protein (TIGR00255 family)
MRPPTGEPAYGVMKSMTGYGRSRCVAGDVEIVTEVRAVNHRFLDISVKVPRMYTAFEPAIRKIVGDRVQRGKLDVVVSRSGGKGAVMDVQMDKRLAGSYYACLRQLKEEFGLSGDITISEMLTLGEIIVPVEKEDALEQEWADVVERSVVESLSALDEMRRTEGAALWTDIDSRLTGIREQVDQIEGMVEEITLAAKQRLEKRIQDLTGGMDIDENRLMQEVALIADRSDVSEELTRLRSHVEQFLSIGKVGSPMGRKLDFLLQELNREVNTVGSKSSATTISTHVVNIKAELEKIREQIQNIE